MDMIVFICILPVNILGGREGYRSDIQIQSKITRRDRVSLLWESIIRKESPMVTSIILMNVERSKINETATALAEMKGISEVYSVSGNYDLVAIARVENNEKLSDLVTRQMLKLTDIQKTETMLAFQSYSRHDLDAMFSIGLDGI
jgi:DNA-binding Lrp family transcriptional regulator